MDHFEHHRRARTWVQPQEPPITPGTPFAAMKSGEVVDYEIDEIRDLAAGLLFMRISEPKAMKSPLC